MEKEYVINFKVNIKKNDNLFEVTIYQDNIKSVMPARSLEEAMQVAMSSVAGFSQFQLGQQL